MYIMLEYYLKSMQLGMTEIYGIRIMHPVEHLFALQRDDDYNIVGSAG